MLLMPPLIKWIAQEGRPHSADSRAMFPGAIKPHQLCAFKAVLPRARGAVRILMSNPPESLELVLLPSAAAPGELLIREPDYRDEKCCEFYGIEVGSYLAAIATPNGASRHVHADLHAGRIQSIDFGQVHAIQGTPIALKSAGKLIDEPLILQLTGRDFSAEAHWTGNPIRWPWSFPLPSAMTIRAIPTAKLHVAMGRYTEELTLQESTYSADPEWGERKIVLEHTVNSAASADFDLRTTWSRWGHTFVFAAGRPGDPRMRNPHTIITSQEPTSTLTINRVSDGYLRVHVGQAVQGKAEVGIERLVQTSNSVTTLYQNSGTPYARRSADERTPFGFKLENHPLPFGLGPSMFRRESTPRDGQRASAISFRYIADSAQEEWDTPVVLGEMPLPSTDGAAIVSELLECIPVSRSDSTKPWYSIAAVGSLGVQAQVAPGRLVLTTQLGDGAVRRRHGFCDGRNVIWDDIDVRSLFERSSRYVRLREESGGLAGSAITPIARSRSRQRPIETGFAELDAMEGEAVMIKVHTPNYFDRHVLLPPHAIAIEIPDHASGSISWGDIQSLLGVDMDSLGVAGLKLTKLASGESAELTPHQSVGGIEEGTLVEVTGEFSQGRIWSVVAARKLSSIVGRAEIELRFGQTERSVYLATNSLLIEANCTNDRPLRFLVSAPTEVQIGFTAGLGEEISAADIVQASLHVGDILVLQNE